MKSADICGTVCLDYLQDSIIVPDCEVSTRTRKTDSIDAVMEVGKLVGKFVAHGDRLLRGTGVGEQQLKTFGCGSGTVTVDEECYGCGLHSVPPQPLVRGS